MGVRVSLALIIFREWRVFAVQQNRATFLPSSFTAVQSNPISLRAKAAESGGGGVRERERERKQGCWKAGHFGHVDIFCRTRGAHSRNSRQGNKLRRERGRTTKLTNRRGTTNGDEKGREDGRMGMLHHACPRRRALLSGRKDENIRCKSYRGKRCSPDV